MNDRLSILSNEIKQIHAQYVQQVGPGGRKVWPKAIKERALELDRLAGSTKRASELTGLSIDLFYYWRSQAKKPGFKALTVVEKKSSSKTITVPNPSAKDISLTVTVTTPTGYRVEGLSEEVLKVLKELGCF